jgi:hypothetical protein
MWWLFAACQAFIPADYSTTLELVFPFPPVVPGCSFTDEVDGFVITHAIDPTSAQCVATTEWRGELVSLDGVRAAVDDMATLYDRDPDDVRRVAIQQLDFEILGATFDGADGEVELPAVVAGRVDVIADEPEAWSVASLTATTDDANWLLTGTMRGTDAGPTRNRNHYEPGTNELLDALTQSYADEEPFEGAITASVRMGPAEVSPIGALGPMEVTIEARIAVGATWWTRIP